MKFRIAFFFSFLLVFGFVGVSYGINYTEAYTLWAGQNMDVGNVWVANDGDYLYVKYELNNSAVNDGWGITETHLHVGETLLEFPLNKKGNPQIGHFEYSMYHNPGVTEYEYMIPLEWEVDDDILIAAHAVVTQQNPLLPNGVDDVVFASKNNGNVCTLYKYDFTNLTATPISDPLNLYAAVQNGTYANGLAYDAMNGLLYFTMQPAAHTNYMPSYFYSFDVANDVLTYLGELPGNTLGNANPSYGVNANPGSIVGASYYDGYYYYIQNNTTKLFKLDVANLVLAGNVITNMIEVVDFTKFVTGRQYTFGDFAIWTDGILYGSSQGNGSSATQFFFKYDILNDSYYDNYNGAKNYQLAFGFDGTLYGIQYSSGKYVEINLTDGTIAAQYAFTGGLYTVDMASGFYAPANSETAWGAGDYFVPNSGSWAMYFGYTITGIVVPDPNDPGTFWVGNTAWAGNTMGSGNAWWYYFDVSDGNPQNIYAGQNLAGGATTVSYSGGKIIIDLDPAYIKFDPSKTDNVKIQGYNDGNVPSSRPAAGLFTTFKGTYTDSDTHIEIPVPAFDNYAIHLDVLSKQ